MAVSPAWADTTRVRMSIEELPRQDKPLEIQPRDAVLPNGARDGSRVPASWKAHDDEGGIEPGARCTDDRRGSVGLIYGFSLSTERIWEKDGKFFLDRADLELTVGVIQVKHAERVQLVRVADGIFGYRQKDGVVLVAARDMGMFDHGAFFECRVAEHFVTLPAGTVTIDSSPSQANAVMREMQQIASEPGKKPKWRPEWTGVELRAVGSVSKSSADPAPMLNLVIKRP